MKVSKKIPTMKLNTRFESLEVLLYKRCLSAGLFNPVDVIGHLSLVLRCANYIEAEYMND